MTRSFFALVVPSVAAGFAALLLYAPPTLGAAAQASSPTTYRESIAGTLVTFEMKLVPGSGAVAPFYIGLTEVTWDLYDIFALGLDRSSPAGAAETVARPSRPYGAPDQGWGHSGYPAISIARTGVDEFTAWLSTKTGKRYRVPTEAEWEHAARLASGNGNGSRIDALAWHRGNSDGRTHPVATRTADALGLFDLFGNAAEWVAPADGSLVTRGGSFRDPMDVVGPAARAVQDDSWNDRDPQLPKSRWWLSDGPFVGFRLASDGPQARSRQ